MSEEFFIPKTWVNGLNPHFRPKYPYCGGTESCKGLLYNVRIYVTVNHLNSLNMPTKWNVRINPDYPANGKILFWSFTTMSKIFCVQLFKNISFVVFYDSISEQVLLSFDTQSVVKEPSKSHSTFHLWSSTILFPVLGTLERIVNLNARCFIVAIFCKGGVKIILTGKYPHVVINISGVAPTHCSYHT